MSEPEPHRARLERFYVHYAADKVVQVDTLLERYAGREEDMFATLVTKYGPEPTTTAAPPHAAPEDHRARLVRFYTAHAPEKLGKVDEALATFAGDEETMFAHLVGKYGPEPPRSVASGSPVLDAARPGSSTSISAPQVTIPTRGSTPHSQTQRQATPLQQQPSLTNDNPYRARLERFYGHHAPDKLDQVDQFLGRFTGREEELFAFLVGKYGPEPASHLASTPPPPTADVVTRRTSVVSSVPHSVVVPVRNPSDRRSSIASDASGSVSRADVLANLRRSDPTVVASDTASAASAGRGAAVAPTTHLSAATMSNRHLPRLVRMFQHYAPEKAATAPKVLTMYAGREDELFAALVDRYGPEPGADTPPEQQQPRQPQQQHRGALPVPSAATSRPLSKASSAVGSEALYSAVAAAAVPTAEQLSNPHRARLLRFYECYAPEKIDIVDGALKCFAGDEATMFEHLVEKYGPEPADHDSVGAIQAGDGANAAASATQGAVEAEDSSVQGSDGARTVAPWAADTTTTTAALLVPSPSQTASVPAADGGTNEAAPRAAHRARLVRFYAAYLPSRLDSIEAILDKYTGREEDMFETLRLKYGPEPAAEDDQPADSTDAGRESSSEAACITEAQQRLEAFFGVYDAPRVPEAAAMARSDHGCIDEVVQALCRRYGGPEPTPRVAAPTASNAAEGDAAHHRSLASGAGGTAAPAAPIGSGGETASADDDTEEEGMAHALGPEQPPRGSPGAAVAGAATLPPDVEGAGTAAAASPIGVRPVRTAVPAAPPAADPGTQRGMSSENVPTMIEEADVDIADVESAGTVTPSASGMSSSDDDLDDAPLQGSAGAGDTEMDAVINAHVDLRSLMPPGGDDDDADVALLDGEVADANPQNVANTDDNDQPTLRTSDDDDDHDDPRGGANAAAARRRMSPPPHRTRPRQQRPRGRSEAAAASLHFMQSFLAGKPVADPLDSDAGDHDDDDEAAASYDGARAESAGSTPGTESSNHNPIREMATDAEAFASQGRRHIVPATLAGDAQFGGELAEEPWTSLLPRPTPLSDAQRAQIDAVDADWANFASKRIDVAASHARTNQEAVPGARRAGARPPSPMDALDATQRSMLQLPGSRMSCAACSPTGIVDGRRHQTSPRLRDPRRVGPLDGRQLETVLDCAEVASSSSPELQRPRWDARSTDESKLHAAASRAAYDAAGTRLHPYHVLAFEGTHDQHYPSRPADSSQFEPAARSHRRNDNADVMDLIFGGLDAAANAAAVKIQSVVRRMLVRNNCVRWLEHRLHSAAAAARDAAHARDRHAAADVSYGFAACEARLRRQRQCDFERVEAAAKKQSVEDRRTQLQSTKTAEEVTLAAAYNAHAAAVRRHNTAMQRAQTAAKKRASSPPGRRASPTRQVQQLPPSRSPGRGGAPAPARGVGGLHNHVAAGPGPGGRPSPARKHLFDAASAAGAAAARRNRVRSPLPSVATGGTRAAPRPPPAPASARRSPPRAHAFATDAAAGDPVSSGLKSAKAREWHARHIAAVQQRWAKEQQGGSSRY